MSFSETLSKFNTEIENAIADIPQEGVVNNPNIYRLVKLLSWSKQASGGSSGGSGGLSRVDLSSELEGLETGVDSLDTILQSIRDSLVEVKTELELKVNADEVQEVSFPGLISDVQYNNVGLSYTGENLTTVLYKQDSTVIAVLTLGYNEDKLTSIVRS